eukprot:gb/GFBE01072039.1/.p1 GENE.gb/GFBE01072039.1/~~gb/GFBE01072039.1/.p1  ORF type:complete len:116 (+),score=36.00 gb/GFBE01072039.1/:1-348(+)
MAKEADSITQFAKIKQEVDLRIPQCIEKVLGSVKEYSHKQVDEWTGTVGESVLEMLQSLSVNFKYIVNVSVLEKKGAGFHTSSATFWDAECDAATTCRWDNKAVFCIVQVFGIGM